jgi:hypothetical protein
MHKKVQKEQRLLRDPKYNTSNLPFKEIMEIINAKHVFFYNENSKKKLNRYAGKVSRRIELAETHLSTHSAKAATRLTDLLDEDGTTPHSNIRLAAANSVLDRVGITKKDQLDINMKAMHGIFILPAKDGIDKNKKES